MNPRKPSALKVVQGTYRKDRANPNEPQVTPLSEIPEPPAFMALHGIARRAWRDLARRTIALGVLSEADLPALASLCRDFADWQEARRDGQAWRRADSAKRRYDAGLRAFGLTPSDRGRVHAAPAATMDPMARWIAEGQAPSEPPPPAPRPKRRSKPSAEPADPFTAWERQTS